MNYLELPDLREVESNLDLWLYETQKLYEKAVKEYIKFKEAHINTQIDFDNKFAQVIKEHKGQGEKVTIVKEIAQAECANEYKAMLMAEAKKKKMTMWVTALENRINMLKYLMRRKYGEMQT